ncbi:MAG TPA: PilZ domain-containing protein [Terriglobales bacterium]|jgi:CheY-like chemotaxis protein|nr:PilZ domain-containing protein [Terriglobales bacterium]
MHLLLLSHDLETVAAFRSSSGEMGIHLYLCDEAREARSALREHRYDAVVIDCDDTHAGRSVLKSVRQARANRTTVVLAILNGDTHGADAFDMGANLVLNKPVSRELARQELHRLRTLVGVDERRFQRHDAQGTAYLSFGRTVDRRADVINIAMGGMGLRLNDRIVDDEILRVRFQLPGTTTVVQAQGEIVWVDPRGGVGIRFVSLSGQARAALEKWLRSRAGSAVS